MAAVRHLDLFYACLDHSQSVVGSLYRCAKFGWNQLCSFEAMRFSIFCAIGLQMPIHAPFGGVFGVKMGENGNVLQFYSSWNAITWY